MHNILNKNYDIIVSLGEDCACATYLQMCDLRLASFPLDWLTKAHLGMRFDLIINGFQDFLNIEDLKIIDKQALGHPIYDDKYDYYENTRNGFHFYHDLPFGKDLNETIIDVKKKYDRRIARLYEKIKNYDNVLLIWLSHAKQNNNEMIIGKAEQICHKFGKNIDFLIIENDSRLQGTGKIEYEKLSDNILRASLDTYSFEVSKNQTLGNIKNCKKVFSQLKLKIDFYTKLKSKFKKIMNFLIRVKNFMLRKIKIYAR